MIIPLLMPEDGAVGASFSQPGLNWQGRFFLWGEPRYGEGVTPPLEKVFTLQVAIDSLFSNIVASETVTDVYTASLNVDLLPETTYYWRVACNGEYSDFNAFYTTFAAPVLTGTNNISIEGTAIKIEWNVDSLDIEEVVFEHNIGEPPVAIYTTLPVQNEAHIVENLPTNEICSMLCNAHGSVEFDYSNVLATAGLETVVINDGTEITIKDHNYIVVSS